MKFLKKHLRKYRNRVIQNRLNNGNPNRGGGGGSNKIVTVTGLLILSAISFVSLLQGSMINKNTDNNNVDFRMEDSVGRRSISIFEEEMVESESESQELEHNAHTSVSHGGDDSAAAPTTRRQKAAMGGDLKHKNTETNPTHRTSIETGRPKTATARRIQGNSSNNNNKVNDIQSAGKKKGEGDQGLNTVECQIEEYHGLSDTVVAQGSEKPVVIRNAWEPPNDEDWKTEEGFLKKFGDVPFYIKNNFVQVQNQDKCIAPFRDLWSYVTNDNNANGQQQQELNKRSMLVFTNDKENPAFFDQLDYDVPDPVKHIDSFTIVSTMTKGQSHEFHQHGESWIGQAAGHKVWWFLPPHHKKPKKVNACDYLSGKARPPPGTKTCMQSPGDVIWFPKNWYHSTCSLTEWNVALGRQLGPRINQKFKSLPMKVGPKKLQFIQQTLQQCSSASFQPQSKKKNLTTKKKNVPSKTTTKLTAATSDKTIWSQKRIQEIKQSTGKLTIKDI